MADFGSLFNTRNDLAPGADYGKGLGGVKPSPFSNPEFIRMLAMIGGKIGAGMSDPGTFGKAAGETAAMMAQGGAAAPVAPTPAAPIAKVDPIAAAKQMKDGASLIDKSNKLDFSQMPVGYIDMIGNALKATPPPIEGTAPAAAPIAPAPTEGAPIAPIANAFAQPQPQPAPQQPAAPALQDIQPFSNLRAMTLGPEGVGRALAQETATGTLDIARREQAAKEVMAPTSKAYVEASTRHMNSQAALDEWKNSPKGREELQKHALALAGEPSRAAAAADEIKNKFRLDQIDSLPTEVRDANVPGTEFTMGQYMRLGVLSPVGLKAATDMAEVVSKNNISRANNQAIIDARKDAKELTAADTAIKQIQAIDTQINNLIKKQSAEELADDPAALSFAKAMGNLRSADTDKQIKDLQTQKMLHTKKVPGWIYSEIPDTDKSKIVVTVEDLKKREAKRIKALEPGKLFNTAPGILDPEVFSDIVRRKPSGGM